MPIRLTPEGALDVESFRALSDDEKQEWISLRLMGSDATVPGGTIVDDDRHLVIAVLYDRLDRDDQRRLRRGVLACLDDATRPSNVGWTDSAKIELVRLVEVITRDSVDESVAVRQLSELIDAQGVSNDVRRRALQALVGIGFTLSEGFWLRQYREPSFGPVVLEGLGSQSLSSAFRFIASAEWTPAFEAAITVLLPDWLDRFGPYEVHCALERAQMNIAPEPRKLLRNLLGLPDVGALKLFENPDRTYEPVGIIHHELHV